MTDQDNNESTALALTPRARRRRSQLERELERAKARAAAKGPLDAMIKTLFGRVAGAWLKPYSSAEALQRASTGDPIAQGQVAAEMAERAQLEALACQRCGQARVKRPGLCELCRAQVH